MLKESSNKKNKNLISETSNISKQKMVCKDGFCSLPIQKEILKQETKNIDLFDPL